MDKAELRVAIAKDVLERIVGDEDVVVTPLTYLARIGGHCTVCAIGGLVVSALENRRLARELGHNREKPGLHRISGSDFKELADDVLGRVFDDEQLGLIEAAFETSFDGFWGNQEFEVQTFGDESRTVGADDVEDYSYEKTLSEDDLRRFEQLRAARDFGVGVGEDYPDVDDLARLRLRKIMQNLIKHAGEFKPEEGYE